MTGQLVAGLVTGILFGILLQRAEVLRYDRQLGALRLVDMTIFKFMLSAVIVGMIGLHAAFALGLAHPHLKPVHLLANLAGGLVFGIGWALLGYCPGTSLGALGEGRWDAALGIAGGLAGAAAFALAWPWLDEHVLPVGSLGKVALPGLLGVPWWVVVPPVVAALVGILYWFERRGL